MKSLLILTILLFISACNNIKDPLSFNSIDYSSQWGFNSSIKILNTGKACIYYKDFNENLKFYSLILDEYQLDSLSQMVKSLYSIKIDTLYIVARDSGRDFCLIINSKNGRLSTTYSGPYEGIEGLKPLYNFIDHLNLLSETLMKSVDSTIVFESRNKLKMILPSPNITK
jgi:hypothetical protein